MKLAFRDELQVEKEELLENTFVKLINFLTKEEISLIQFINGYLILIDASSLRIMFEHPKQNLAKMEFQTSSEILPQPSLKSIQVLIEQLKLNADTLAEQELTQFSSPAENGDKNQYSFGNQQHTNSTFKVTLLLKVKNKKLFNTDKIASAFRLFLAVLLKLPPVSLTISNISIETEKGSANLLAPQSLTSSGIFSQVELSQLHPALARAILFLNKNFQSDITMKQLAAECYVSTSHLSSLFKQQFKLSFKKILTHLRIEKAKSILNENPHRQITHICSDAGFSDLSHFEKTFKRYVGMTPGKFRRLVKESSSSVDCSIGNTIGNPIGSSINSTN